jgi:hypothetical protein
MPTADRARAGHISAQGWLGNQKASNAALIVKSLSGAHNRAKQMKRIGKKAQTQNGMGHAINALAQRKGSGLVHTLKSGRASTAHRAIARQAKAGSQKEMHVPTAKRW